MAEPLKTNRQDRAVRITDLARDIYVHLIVSGVALVKTPEHLAGEAIEKAAAFYRAVDQQKEER